MRLSGKTLRHLLVCLGTLAFAPTGGPPLRADMTVEDIVDNVRRNEGLYENIDVTLYHEHRIDEDEAPSTGTVNEIVSLNSRTKFVSQDGLFRLDRTGKSTTAENEYSDDRVSAFDGDLTRIYEQNTIANIAHHKQQEPDGVRPHMLLFRTPSVIRCALSTLLSGERARGDELARLSDEKTREVTYLGAEDFNGLRCHRIRVTTIVKPDWPSGHWDLWLAEDRNYLPVRRLDFRRGISDKIPEGEGVVEEFREIEPGIWFPFAVRATGYNAWAVQTKGIEVPHWHARFATEAVSLHPRYPREYFADVPFSDGTAVYEIQGKDVVRSYVKGAPHAASSARPGTGARWWIIIANILIAAGTVIYLLSRSLTRNPQPRKVVNTSNMSLTEKE